MGSLHLNKLFDPIRKRWVVPTPEEIIRQKWISFMSEKLGYPPTVLCIEKALQEIPHLNRTANLPTRRLDLICFAQEQPLLIIEFKAIPLTESAFEQIKGYNHYVKAPFIAIANDEEIKTGWVVDNEYQFIHYLPPYEELKQCIKKP